MPDAVDVTSRGVRDLNVATANAELRSTIEALRAAVAHTREVE